MGSIHFQEGAPLKEDRVAIWNAYSGEKTYSLERMFLAYDRYDEASKIVSSLSRMGIRDLTVLDYGCGVGDYGIALARAGHRAMFYDIEESALNFVRYRFQREGLSFHELGDHDAVVYGEVLEHVEKPSELLERDIERGVRVIFTSSYPYRSDDPSDSYWQKGDHKDSARLDQARCRELLESNFSYVKYDGQKRLWTR